MDSKEILVLGGYGNVSRFLCDLILSYTNSSIIIAGRSLYKADSFKKELSNKYDKNRISTKKVNAADEQSLIDAFSQADFVINSASTLEHTRKIINALLETKKDYLDLLLSSPVKLNSLKKAEGNFIENGQCIITDGGFHPGIPLAMVKYAAKEFDELNKANIGSLLNIDWKFERSSQDTIDEFIREMKDYDSTAFKDGSWKKLGYKDFKYFDFGEPFGKKPCIPMNLQEMKLVTKYYPCINETGFYISGFNWFTDYLVMPLLYIGVKLFHVERLKVLTTLFSWSLKKFTKPPYKIILQLEAEGKKDGISKKYKLTISHNDGYALTAISAAACILQYLDGSIGKPGLHFQADIVEPQRFIEDLGKLGCTVTSE